MSTVQRCPHCFCEVEDDCQEAPWCSVQCFGKDVDDHLPCSCGGPLFLHDDGHGKCVHCETCERFVSARGGEVRV